MMQAKFYLDSSRDKSKPSLIFLIHKCFDKRLKYSTFLRIVPKKWDKKKMRVQGRTGEAKNINHQLEIVETAFLSVMIKFQRNSINPERDVLKEELDMVLGRTVPPTPEEKGTSLIAFCKMFIEERSKQGNNYSKSTIKKYNVVRHGLEKYIKARKLKHLEFEDITHNFYNDFIAFLFSQEGINSKNTLNYYIGTLKLFMRESQKRGMHKQNDYREFKGMTDKSEAIYLNSSEIKKLWELDLSQNKRLERVRDIFLMGCETGLRFSDFSQISEENIQTINGVHLIRMVQQKTEDEVTIPLKPIAKAILEKYDNKMPRAITNQKMNLYLKELGEIAGIDEVVTLRRGGGVVTDKKYNLISTHTARRSFATNAYLARVPSLAIMKITGHKSEKSFRRYIKVDSLESALNIASHPFFTGEKNEKKSPLRKVS